MNIKYVLFFLIFTLCYNTGFSQKKITWKELSTAYLKEYRSNKSDNQPSIKFNEADTNNKEEDKNTLSLKEIEGKEVTVRGYFLDLGADAMWYMLSRFPFENCFFCTGVGPETVIEIGNFENKKSKFKTDDIVTVTGILYLMKIDGEYFYILKNSSVELFES